MGLPALVALLLASLSIAFSIALFTAAAGLPGGSRPVLVALSGPDAVPAPAGVHGSADLDVLAGYLRAAPAAGSDGVFAVTVGVSELLTPGAERHHLGRAPPHTG